MDPAPHAASHMATLCYLIDFFTIIFGEEIHVWLRRMSSQPRKSHIPSDQGIHQHVGMWTRVGFLDAFQSASLIWQESWDECHPNEVVCSLFPVSVCSCSCFDICTAMLMGFLLPAPRFCSQCQVEMSFASQTSNDHEDYLLFPISCSIFILLVKRWIFLCYDSRLSCLSVTNNSSMKADVDMMESHICCITWKCNCEVTHGYRWWFQEISNESHKRVPLFDSEPATAPCWLLH